MFRFCVSHSARVKSAGMFTGNSTGRRGWGGAVYCGCHGCHVSTTGLRSEWLLSPNTLLFLFFPALTNINTPLLPVLRYTVCISSYQAVGPSSVALPSLCLYNLRCFPTVGKHARLNVGVI